ncbi:MAG: translocation/assembly module TamB domain-containing protein [Oligoflexia bacterium]|nr:translocation/assembly module TamB domain-containing protein [Oligoflexia bacterium]
MKFIRYFLITVLFLIIGIVYAREVPKLKKWLLAKIQIVSTQKLGIEIKAKSIEFELIPLGVKFTELRIQPKKELSAIISPALLDGLGIYLSPLSLLVGRFEIGNITLIHPQTNVFIKRKNDDKNEKFELPWDQFLSTPIKSVNIIDGDIRLLVKDTNLAFQLTGFNLSVVKNFQAARVEFFGPDIKVKRIDVPDSLTTIGLAARIVIEKNAAEVAALKLTFGENFIIARGVAQGAVTKLDWSLLNGKTIAHTNLTDFVNLVNNIYPAAQLPAMEGMLNFEVSAKQKRGQEPEISAQVETQDAKIQEYKIGNLLSKLKYSSGVLTSDEVSLATTAGRIRVQNLNAKIGKETHIAGRIVADELELRQLLLNLDIDVPVHLEFKGRIPCEGMLLPEIKISCAGELTGEKFRVYTEPENDTVVALDNFKVLGSLSLDKEKIVFQKALISIGNSQGTASGSVNYTTGFSFNYHTDGLDFKDVKSLADLDYEGVVATTGSTRGTSDWGIIDTQLKMKNFWFEQHALGSGTMRAYYEKGSLTFSDVDAILGSTNYKGKAIFNLSGKKGLSAHIDIPKIDIADIIYMFSKKVQLPFAANGIGSGSIDVSGPFEFSALTYKVRSHFKSGMIADEAFKEAHFDMHAIKGNAVADSIYIKKGDGNFVLTGDVNNNGIMNVGIAGRGFHVTDFDYIKNLTSGFGGRINADIVMREYILKPKTTITGTITQTTINQEVMEDSQFSMTIAPQSLNLSAQVFAQKIKLALLYPFNEKGPFAFKLDTNNWDFSNLLGLFGKSAKRDYETGFTAQIDLNSPQGGFWDSSGTIDISKFYVRHGNSQMRNTQPISAKFDNGTVTLGRTQIDGDNTQLTLNGTRSKNDQINFNVNGRIDLSLLTFLTPFFRDMTGLLSLSTQIAGTSTKPDLLGSAFITKGYVKLDELPHPFEDIQADFLFSQSKALLNRFTGVFGGGKMSATGSLLFKGYRDIPVEISGELLNATLNIPEGLTTKGALQFSVLGNWFPYLFKAEYNIESGLFSKNFTDENTDSTVKRSAYLPKIILQKDFHPLELDINAHFPKLVFVKNNLMDAEVKGDLNIKGEPSYPVFKGDIEATQNGKIFFRETPFNISATRIKYNNPTENNPNIYILGTTRVRDWDIQLLVQGTQQKNKIELKSSPHLPEQKIISLLALGLTDDSIDKTGTNEQLTIQGYQAGSLLLAENPLRNELKKKFGVNVRLSQSVDATKNVVLQRLVAEKQWTPQISTSFSRSIGDQVSRDVNVEYKLNRNLSILGSYEGRDYDPLAAQSTSISTQPQSNFTPDVFGLDLQYQVEFR